MSTEKQEKSSGKRFNDWVLSEARGTDAEQISKMFRKQAQEK